MVSEKVYQWLNVRDDRKVVLRAFHQPLISRQISKRTGILQSTCSYIIATFVDKGLLICLNPAAQNSRLYWLTEKGHRLLKKLAQNHNQIYLKPQLPEIDWPLYGWLCYTHRSVIIRVLNEPMRPSEIKRVLSIQRPSIRISAGNVRDIIQLFLLKSIVRPVTIRGKVYPYYKLTDLGIKCRDLLIRADTVL